jgi:hypothetical protein
MIGFCILLHVILIVNNTFCFATIDKVFYYVASVLTRHVSALILGHNQVNLQNIKKEALFIQRIRCVE